MILSQIESALVFIVCMLILSLALGSLALHLPRFLLIPRWSRFLVGACTFPFVIPPLMMLIAAIMPGAPQVVFLCIPPTLALGIIVIYGRRTFLRLRRPAAHQPCSSYEIHPSRTMHFLIGVAAALTLAVLVKNALAPLLYGDILEYAGSGLLFATKRSFAVLGDMSFQGTADGSLRGYMHSYAWPLYLSYAIMFNGGQPLGYPADQALRIAIQLTIGIIGLAIMALIRVRWPLRVGVFALLVLLAVPSFSYMTVNCSRDAFRITPHLLLITALCGLSPQRLSRRLPLGALVPLLLFSAMSLSGHTLGGIVAVLICFAWLIWILHGRQIRWGNLAKVALAIAAGLAISSGQYVEAVMQSGMIDGGTIGLVAEQPVATVATPVSSVVYTRTILQGLSGAARNVARAILDDGHLIGLAGTVTAFGLIMWYWSRQQAWRLDILPFLSLITLCLILPFTGMLNVFGVNLADMMFSNPRYILHWYPVSAIVVAAFLCGGSVMAESLAPSGVARLGSAGWLPRVKVAIKILIGLVAVTTIGREWVPRSLFNYRKLLDEKFMPVVQIAQGLGTDERLWLEDDRYNYYLNNRAIVMFSQPAKLLIQAKSEAEVERHLAAWHIVLLALEEKSLDRNWADTVMLRVAQKKCNAPLSIPSLYGSMRVFVVGDFATYYNRLFDWFDTAPLSQDGIDPTMFIDCYVNEVISRGNTAVDQAISDQRKRASKHSPWHYIVLGRLLEKSGRPDDAQRQYLSAREFWQSSERCYPAYYDEMKFARACIMATTGETSKAAGLFSEIAYQTAIPLLRVRAVAAAESMKSGANAAGFSVPRNLARHDISPSWMIPDELFWKSFAPKTTYYKLASIRGSFTTSVFESTAGTVLRVMPGSNAQLGSDYIQVGLWLPEHRSWVLREAKNNNQVLPVLQPNATLYFSAAIRLSSTNETACLLIRNLISSVEGSQSMMLRGADWMTGAVACVVAADFKESRWCSRCLASLPFDRLPGRWRGLTGMVSFIPDEQKYAPVIEWMPKSTNAWLEIRDARLLLVAP